MKTAKYSPQVTAFARTLGSAALRTGLFTLSAAVCFALLAGLACSGSHSSSPSDYAQEAAGQGWSLPTSTVRGVSNVTLSANGSTIAGTGADTSGSTSAGVITLQAGLDSGASALGNVSMMAWVNGQAQVLSLSGSVAGGNVVMSTGDNYIAAVVYDGASPYGRSLVFRVHSTTAASAARVELTWTGIGDVDLHVDDGSGGKHVYFGSQTYNAAGYNIQLDVDNVVAYGPENIRFYSLPATSTFRIYVNYFYGGINQTATVRVYNATGGLVGTYTHVFTPADALESSAFGTWSWNVGNLTVSPTASAGNLNVEPWNASVRFTTGQPE